MSEVRGVRYRLPEADDAEMLLNWRTAPDVTRWCFSDIAYDIPRQRRWLAEMASKPGFVHRIICAGSRDVGYASITVTDAEAGVGTLGVYLGDVASRTGPAGLNFIHILNHAFFAMRLNKIVNHILDGNRRLVRAQPFNGYRHVGVLRQHHRKGDTLYDVHVFEMLRGDWLGYRRKFGDWRDMDGVVRDDAHVADFTETSAIKPYDTVD